jgi:hypothetical protein
LWRNADSREIMNKRLKHMRMALQILEEMLTAENCRNNDFAAAFEMVRVSTAPWRMQPTGFKRSRAATQRHKQ